MNLSAGSRFFQIGAVGSGLACKEKLGIARTAVEFQMVLVYLG
jgi:hypothetical protein